MEKSEGDGSDVESGRGPSNVPHWRLVKEQGVVTAEVLGWRYKGSGTEEDPYVVVWIEDDPGNPMLYSTLKKWTLTMVVAVATLAVAFVSSAYSGGTAQIVAEFGASQLVVTLGISLFVLGFAIGPLLWAPLSELYGRQVLFFVTYGVLTAFNAGAAASPNVDTLIVLRFFAGAFGSSPLTNAGGVIADMFPASQRGLAMSIFAAAPFMGPVLGPIAGGFLAEAEGWRWVEGLMAIFTGALWVVGFLTIPETYAPVLLRKRADALSKMTGKVYRSKQDVDQPPASVGQAFKTALSRPWMLLFREPIVLLLSIYMAIIYGTLYMLFGAFPIVYQQERGWSAGIGGLAFLGVAVGMIIAVIYTIPDNKRYNRRAEEHGGFAPPEVRLPPALIGGVAIPIGLFWFAWTNSPSIHWIASIAAGVPFGFGMVLVFLSIINYLIDAYTIYAASVLAANTVLRSIFGAVFPLFTSYMYQDLGIHWASTIPAFLALACVPFPFLFYKYGAGIRERCKYAAEADAFMRSMRDSSQEDSPSDEIAPDDEEKTKGEQRSAVVDDDDDKKHADVPRGRRRTASESDSSDATLAVRETEEEGTEEAAEDEGEATSFAPVTTATATAPTTTTMASASETTHHHRPRSTPLRRTPTRDEYEIMNPYDVERVYTNQGFVGPLTRSRASSRARASAKQS